MKVSQKICAIKKIIVKVWVGAAVALGFFLASTVPAYAGWEYGAFGWWYQNDDGTYPVAAWKEIDGRWYYFDLNGYMAVGWIQSGGKWYYLNPDGSLAVNCWINGTYYVGADGAMYVNRTTPDGYRVGADGAYVQEALSQEQVKAIYQQKLNQCKALLGSSNYYEADYLIEDFNKDGILDLLLFETQRSGNSNSDYIKAELYTVANGTLVLCDTLINEDMYSPFDASRKNGYVLVNFSTSRHSDYIYSISSSLHFMKEIYYSHSDGQIYENANHIYSGCIHEADINEGTWINMKSL